MALAAESMSEVHSGVSSEILNHKLPPRETYELINSIGRDLSIKCLLHCSRSDYGSIACLNQSFRSLIRSGDLYKLRRKMGITEPWIYFSHNALEWTAYDPYCNKLISLPPIRFKNFSRPSNMAALVVSTEIFVFWMRNPKYMIRYSILTNSWSLGKEMNIPRSFCGSASFGEKTIIAGGTNEFGHVLKSAELYNSELQAWETLPNMNKRRMSCSGVFMDGKFYMIGGIDKNNHFLTCGEEYDPVRRKWRVIPNMSYGLDGDDAAPPHVAVLNNELYAANDALNKVMKYDKMNNSWITLGQLPVTPSSVKSLRIELCACGESLIVISGYTPVWNMIVIRGYTSMFNTNWLTFRGDSEEECDLLRSELRTFKFHSWIPNERKPEWNVIVKKRISKKFVNCAVMSC